MGSQDNKDIKKTIDSISNTVSGDGRKFVAELKAVLKNFKGGGVVDGGEGGDLGEGAVEQVIGLKLLETHSTNSSGVPINNIQVTFDTTNVDNFKHAQIWMKSRAIDYVQVGITSGVKYIIENVTAGETYTVKVVAGNKNGGTSKFDEAPEAEITIKGSVLIPEAPTQFYLTWDIDGALWQWLYEDNGYIDFFELRLDKNAGSYDEYLLDRTRNNHSRVEPPTRSGTAYLFVRNIFGTYSSPAEHTFNKPIAGKPNAPVLEPTLDGVVITMDALPSGYQGWHIEINDEVFTSYNRQFTYYQFSGEITVRYCFFDKIGDGEWSDSVTQTIKLTLGKDDLPEISYEEFDQSVKDAIDAANNQKEINDQLNADIEAMLGDVEAMRKDIEGLRGDIDGSIGEATGELREAVDTIVDNLNKDAVDSPFTSIKQNNDSITALAATVSVVDGKTQTNAAQITITNERIDSLVLQVEEVDGKTQTNASNITQTAERLESLVYEQTEVLDEKISTNASQIKQTADEITAMVNSEVSTLDGKISTNASQIKQNADGITTLSAKIEEVDGKTETNASEIKVLNDSITAVAESITELDGRVEQNTASIKLTDDSITSVVSKLNGTAEESGFNALTGLASSIVQTNESITSVVTELNKDPDECSYSAITQLQDGIDLCVKDEDLNGDEIVTRINLSEGGVTIDGKWLHITGNTIIDDDVSVAGTLAADSVMTEHLKANAVTTAKIATNAITADKIAADSITTEKITDKSVTSVKIEDGAITTTKIVDGAVSSTKIEGGAITTEHIQAGSIIGEHISAGAVTAQAIAAGAVTAQAIAAGAINAETLGVDSLSAISAKIGTLKTADSGARMVIQDNLIQIYDSNNVLRVRMGVW